MKKLWTVIIMLALCFMVADQAMAGRAKNRQINQQKRIHQGVRSGELTGQEIKALEHEQWRIQKSKQRALGDGVVTPKERIRLEAQQDRASHHIYRMNHNDKQP